MQRDPTCCGDVRDPCRNAGGKRVQNVFDRRRAVVLAAEHCRVVRLGGVGCFVAVFAAGAGEVGHRGLHMRSTQPLALGTKLESGELRLVLHDVDCGEQAGGMDPIEGGWSFFGEAVAPAVWACADMAAFSLCGGPLVGLCKDAFGASRPQGVTPR